jgi:hypothetical protein
MAWFINGYQNTKYTRLVIGRAKYDVLTIPTFKHVSPRLLALLKTKQKRSLTRPLHCSHISLLFVSKVKDERRALAEKHWLPAWMPFFNSNSLDKRFK